MAAMRRRLLITAASAGVCLLLLELGARWLEGSTTRPGDGRESLLELSENPDIAYRLRGGASGNLWECDVQANSLGFRDREFGRKAEGARRVLVLGDSMTFGHRVAADDVYARQLEVRLGAGVEVFNLSLGGYDTLNEAALLKLHGPELAPDLVILGYCINDIGLHSVNLLELEQAARAHTQRSWSALGRLLEQRLARTQAEADDVDLNTPEEFRRRYDGRLADIAGDAELEALRLKMAAAVAAKRGKQHQFGVLEEYCEPTHLQRLRYGLEWVAASCAALGVDGLVVVLPFLRKDTKEGVYALADEIVAHEARRAGLQVLLMRPRLRGTSLDELRTKKGDSLHLNARGHGLVADAIAAYLSAQPEWSRSK
jgi:lysophospholipase L1-like esterase